MTMRTIPVYQSGELVLAVELDVPEPEADGEVWLTPQQVDLLESARDFARAWVQSGEQACESAARHRLSGLVTIGLPAGQALQ